MTQKFLGHPLLVFYTPDCPKRPYRQKSRRQQQARSAQVLRNSPRAMQLTGYELVRTELTCKESVLMCFD